MVGLEYVDGYEVSGFQEETGCGLVCAGNRWCRDTQEGGLTASIWSKIIDGEGHFRHGLNLEDLKAVG